MLVLLAAPKESWRVRFFVFFGRTAPNVVCRFFSKSGCCVFLIKVHTDTLNGFVGSRRFVVNRRSGWSRGNIPYGWRLKLCSLFVEVCAVKTSSNNRNNQF